MVTVAGEFKCTCGMMLVFAGEETVKCWWCRKVWQCKEEERDKEEVDKMEINI